MLAVMIVLMISVKVVNTLNRNRSLAERGLIIVIDVKY